MAAVEHDAGGHAHGPHSASGTLPAQHIGSWVTAGGIAAPAIATLLGRWNWAWPFVRRAGLLARQEGPAR
jgi:hypothetical protein